MRIGPLYVNPTIALSNAGQDTNVFDEAPNPKTDFTVTISPGTDLWLRFGPTWFQSNIKEDLVWFNKYASERSANNSYNVKWTVPLSRLTLTPTWSYVNTRERPGFEIDARAQRNDVVYGGTVDFRFLSRTSVVAEARRSTTDFDKATVFLGANLHDELNRTATSVSLGLKHQITPLTSFTVAAASQQDRFDFDALRNSESRSITAGIKFDPAALIKGSATFGYRDFKPASSALPGYQGSTAAVDLTYVLLGTTKFAVTATRDVQYSFDINQPYYVATGGAASVSQQLFGPLDVVGRAGLQRMEYRDRIGAVVAMSDRIDHSTSYGAGLGYHLGRDMRIGFNIDKSRRNSGVETRRYEGMTYGLAVTYGS